MKARLDLHPTRRESNNPKEEGTIREGKGGGGRQSEAVW